MVPLLPPPPSVFRQADAQIKQPYNARVGDSVVDVIPIAPRSEDPSIHQTPQLIGNCLGLHLDGASEVADAHLSGPHQRVKQSEARRIGQNLESSPHRVSLIVAD